MTLYIQRKYNTIKILCIGDVSFIMHELGVLYQALDTVSRIAEQNKIQRVKLITLEVGDTSGFVPAFFEKLFPAAADAFPKVKDAQLRIITAAGKGLIIKDIGY